MQRLPKDILMVCACLFSLTGHAIVISPDIQVEPAASLQTDAGRAYLQGDYQTAAILYRPMAEHGDAEAPLILGSMYDVGRGVRQDYGEAFKWYRLAAEHGNARAQWKLGAMYDIGLGVSQDNMEAMKWWRLAAEQGDAFAQLNLGAKYDHGRGVPKDLKEAVKWYRLSAEQGNAFAQEKLAWKYLLGEGVAHDDVLAYMWLNLAASDQSTLRRKAAIQQRIQQRDALARGMTADQLAKARELVRSCAAHNFRGCQ